MIWTIQQTVDLAHGDQAASRMNYVNPLAYPGDENAHEWRVTVKENGASVDLSNATITAYVKRVDGNAVLLHGTGTSDGVASVIFDSEVYLYSGQIAAIMRAVVNQRTITIAALNATVLTDISGSPIVDPTGIIPSIDVLLAEIDRMEAATDAAETAVQEVDDIVIVSDTQPTSETNKLWFTPNGTEVEVPTMEEFEMVESDVDDLKSDVSSMNTATVIDEGKALKAKTVTNGKVIEWEFGEAGGGLTATQANLLLTILEEGVYGSDQEANIELLRKALMDIAPVSISAVLESIPLVGLYYADLEFIVTATFDDASTMVVDGYRIVTPGAVVSGSNTVTLAYRGVATNVTFTASSEQTYNIGYNLSNVSASNNDYLIIAGERYETVLTVDEGHYISSVIVMMDGTDITSTAYTSGTQTILIPEVNGDVSITALAEAYIYMDDLLFTRNDGFSNCNGYPNESTSESSIIGGNYIYAPFVAEYPALHDCVVHWKITNVTENDLALENCGFGSLDTYRNNIYGASSAVINAFNCVKADNLSHKLTAGESLEGDVSVKAGWSLCFICRYENFASFGIELVGSYAQNTFDGYTEIAPTQATAPNFGAYRNVNYYSDDGNTLIKTNGGYPAAIKTNIEPGTYDVYYATKAKTVPSNTNSRNVFAIFGGMKQNTDTDVYFAGGSALTNGYNIWFHTQFVITENDMTLVAAILYFNLLTANDPKLSILYKKVVTE